jgi:hypothetical protein
MKGPSTRKIVAVIVAAVLILIGGVAFWINAVAVAKFERLERDVKALHEELLRRETSRPPRPGPVLPGNAWTDYEQALKAVRADKSLEAVDLFLRRSGIADPAKARERVAAHAATLDLLKSGARRERGDLGISWERAPSIPQADVYFLVRLGILAAARARFLVEEGKSREAAELLLDGCQLARDVGANSIGILSMVSTAIYDRQLDGLRDLILSDAMSKEDLVLLGAGLEAADRSFPGDELTPQNEVLFTGYTLLNVASSPDLGASSGVAVSRPKLWRSGFSVRLAFASAFEEVRALCERASGSESLTWVQARVVLGAVDREAAASRNPVVPDEVPRFLSIAQEARVRRAQLRLLRAAVAWRETRAFPELDDPFGTTLLQAEKDGVIRVWSVGRDGFTHGGVGSWKSEVGKDLLLEWKR